MKENFRRVLSSDFVVLCYIYEQTEIEKRNICFSQIAKEIELKQQTVSKSIDRLYDHMMIDAEWKKVEDGNWAYCFTVSDSFMGFTKVLYNATQDVLNAEKEKQEESKKVVEQVRENKNAKKATEPKENKTEKPKTSKKENEFK